MFLNGYPYTDFHELNLDYLMKAMTELKVAFKDFTASNALIFAEPLLHDISKSYAKNTIVLDPDGNAYISIKTVPSGVQLGNTEYWLMVFNFEEYTEKANKNFTDNYFRDVTRSDRALSVDDWIVLDDILYRVTAAIAPDELFEVGVNIVHFTVEQFLKDFITSVNQIVRDYKEDTDEAIEQYYTDMQAEVDRILAGATVDSEVIDARQGYNGTNYTTLGLAIRTQVSDIYDTFERMGSYVNDRDYLFELDTVNLTITLPGTPRILYKKVMYNLSTSALSYTSTSPRYKAVVYDTSDSTTKIVNYNAVTNDQIIAFIFSNNAAELRRNGCTCRGKYLVNGVVRPGNDMKWGMFMTVPNEIAFVVDWTNDQLVFYNTPSVIYGNARWQIPNGALSYAATTATGQKFVVYDEADSSWKIIDYTAYTSTQIIAFAFQRNKDYLRTSPYATSLIGCKYQVDEFICPRPDPETIVSLDDPTGLTQFVFPGTFGHTLPIDVYKCSERYTTDFDVSSYKKTITDACYLSPTGADTNTGSDYYNAFKSIKHAIDEGFDTLYLAPGVYYYVANQTVASPINLIGIGDVKIIFGDPLSGYHPTIRLTFSESCYVENIKFYGGVGVVSNYAGSDPLVFNNCGFYDSAANGFNGNNEKVIMYQCEAANNMIDGLNYHEYDGNTPPDGIVEIECRSHNNGNAQNRSCNCSTIHDHGRIIRLNCKYHSSHGGVVADSAAISYNFGCSAENSMYNSDSNEFCNAAFASLNYNDMYLYDCMGAGCDYIWSAYNHSNIFVDVTPKASKCYVDSDSSITTVTP